MKHWIVPSLGPGCKWIEKKIFINYHFETHKILYLDPCVYAQVNILQIRKPVTCTEHYKNLFKY